MNKMRFIDFFSGIGGFRLGFEQAGFECVGYAELDKFARRSYEAMYDTSGEWTAWDIRTVDPAELPEADIYTCGFPCQSFSIAGKRGGFEDTRGTLFFEVLRLAKARKPRFLVCENVKGLLSHDGGRTFETIINALGELGYSGEWQVINSKYYVPQNRDRVYIVGHLGGFGGRAVFPIERESGGIDEAERPCTNTITASSGTRGGKICAGSHIIENRQPETKEGQIMQIGTRTDYGGKPRTQDRVYAPSGVAPTLTANGGGGHEPKIAIPVLTPDRITKRQNGRRFKDDGEEMFTLTAQDRHGVIVGGIYTNTTENFQRGILPNCSRALKSGNHDAGVVSIDLKSEKSTTRRGMFKTGKTGALDTNCNQAVIDGLRIRKLTPRECFRLQGFTKIVESEVLLCPENACANIAAKGSCLQGRKNVALKTVRINCEGNTLQIRSQGKLYSFVNGAAGENSSALYMPTDDFVLLIAFTSLITEKIIHDTKRIPLIVVPENILKQKNGTKCELELLKEIPTLAKCAGKSYWDANIVASTISSTLDEKQPNTTLRILCFCVIRAIQRYMQEIPLRISFRWVCDDLYDRAAAVNSDRQLYKQAGNSVTVPVIYEIAKALRRLKNEN